MAPGTLFVVATPIGNLEDITLRALRVLREADVVAAEDTRRTANLLRHYDIRTPLLSLHEHNERQRTPQILERLRDGQSVAIVSDAGTPGISDPGAALIRAARGAGFPVTPVPGASAVTAVLGAAGLSVDRFAFGGFPPTRSKDRKTWLEWVRSLSGLTIVCFEAPHRLRKTLADFGRILGERPITVAREVTKIHEEWYTGSARQLLDHFLEPRGEFVLIIRPSENTPGALDHQPDDSRVLQVFGQITENGSLNRRAAVKRVAQQLGLSARQVYLAVERAKNLVK